MADSSQSSLTGIPRKRFRTDIAAFSANGKRQVPRIGDATWYYSRSIRADDPEQGWKLHVSATIASAAEVLARAETILCRRDVLFKTPANLQQLLEMNSGAAGFPQIGKFITVYPRSTAEAVMLARELDKKMRGLAAPRVPFDYRYRAHSLVYYRYGAFKATPDKPAGFIRGPKGRLYRDWRAPKKAVPAWVENPFHRNVRKARKSPGPIGLDYLVYRAITQRGKGGVYQAIDLSVSPARTVIIKEGRRHGETDRDGKDGYARIRQEGKALRILNESGLPVPKVLREFVQNRNRYVVLESIVGRPLIARARIQPSRPSWHRATRILDRLCPILSTLHAAGWVWRDCKPSHIFLHRGAVRLIDFELACRVGERRISPLGSADYLPPGFRERRRRRLGTQEDDFALGVIVFQFLCGEFPPCNWRRRSAFYRRTGCPDSLRTRIEGLLRY
jgi:class IV lanthipeptide synthase